MVLLFGLLLLPFQAVKLSIAQPAHLWVLFALAMMLLYRSVKISVAELVVYIAFLYFAFTLTFFQDYPRIKEYEQLIKFALFYPSFYLVGRWLGGRYANRDFPLGYGFLFLFLAFQYVTQALELPVIFEALDFGQGALHGTFRERNWLAVYFLLFSYILVLRDKTTKGFVLFIVFNAIVMLLSGSKTTFIAAGIAFLLHSRLPIWIRIFPTLIGAVFYISLFSDELSGDKLAVKLEEERGLALLTSLDLLKDNPLGFGWGFVEAFFSNSWIVVKGLGEGTNSVFSVPLDLWIIAGPIGFLMWLVIFVGVGNSSIKILAPIAALSFLNPLHQSELVYFFIGVLVSYAKFSRPRLSTH
ncbi:hypothetical protein AX760_19650 [Pararhizobium antarcticum]|uniref:Uncharacterized protein n=1 Tax=Pararhizobium antarcticum TaxID=1798805 RepID=A0A657LS47_9HYPH|nr:hypothetical protein AX760_19650 [Pararhizobium antarcticum]OJF96351.1 hypothetical protein AX761_15885 [Rhizobium sp. 58]